MTEILSGCECDGEVGCSARDCSAKARSVKNECAKTRKVDEPYEIYRAGDWEWRVLKKYQSPVKEAANPYARWFCAVKSPMTHGSWEYGDTYVTDIKRYATRVA